MHLGYAARIPSGTHGDRTPIAELDERADSPHAPRVIGHAAQTDEEVSLLDLLIVLAQRKRTIVLVPVALRSWPPLFRSFCRRATPQL